MADDKWLLWAREIQAISQIGLTFSRNVFDRQRFERLRELAAEIVAHHASINGKDALALFEAQSGYATPKVDVRAACFRDDRLLLVRERADGHWTLPGGWADVNQSAAESAVREVKEESGFDVRVLKLAAVLDRSKHGHPPSLFHTYKLFFIRDILGGAPRTSDETDGVDFFAIDRLPALSFERVLPAQIARLYEHRLSPDLPTDFD